MYFVRWKKELDLTTSSGSFSLSCPLIGRTMRWRVRKSAIELNKTF